MPRTTGTYRPTTIAGRAVEAFIPAPLPLKDPALDLGGTRETLLTEAQASLERLSLVGRLVPSIEWFIYGFVRKEALISSQIEGTQATLEDVLEFEATERSDRPDDVEEVCNYVAALTYARRELSSAGGLPVSTRLLCEAHKLLMKGARGGNKDPGHLRKVQNWIGGRSADTIRFVPPPPDALVDAMHELDRWIHSEDPTHPLVKAGLAHVQFETIHPFLDGNGRIGRLLIALLLEHWGLLDQPLLYISAAIRRDQSEYYQRLSAVRTEGDWEGWTEFFLRCVRSAADDGVSVTTQISALVSDDRKRLARLPGSTLAAVQLFDMLPEHPVVTGPLVMKLMDTSAPTARRSIDILQRADILVETTGKLRDRAFTYRRYVKALTGEDSGDVADDVS
ncbi:MAG: Fic family protein [Phycisphaerales bacterium]|nr:Fic family protein [Phycisphaerales bacterium]